jgi:hypothetical protein
MYSRVLYENWHSIVPIVAFAVSVTVFVFAITRSLVMRKDTADTMAAKPLDDGDRAERPTKLH